VLRGSTAGCLISEQFGDWFAVVLDDVDGATDFVGPVGSGVDAEVFECGGLLTAC